MWSDKWLFKAKVNMLRKHWKKLLVGPTAYKIMDNNVSCGTDKVQNYKDLGVTFDHKLIFFTA